MLKTATVILNRNLPDVTDALVEHIYKYDKGETDVFVVEAGSEDSNLSKYCTWHVKTDDVRRDGLRYSRGMNYGLLKLFESDLWGQYESFFLLTNDTELPKGPSLKTLREIFSLHNKLSILSPCSIRWGERFLLKDETTKYFWYIHGNALLVRKEFIESILPSSPSCMNFLFDGQNFRGYLGDVELIAKAYANDWAAAITSKVFVEENETYLLSSSDLIKTEPYEKNIELYVEEGRRWLKDKYGFRDHWTMTNYSKILYDQFFKFNPQLSKYRI